jgi:SAM-dependent methyltransferase
MWSECKLCRHSEFIPIVTRPSVSILQNRVFEDVRLARSAAVGRLEIVCCTNCGFIFNRAFEPDNGRDNREHKLRPTPARQSSTLPVYDPSYDNAQFFSPCFEHMRERAANLLERSRALGSILELGCGQGTFLDMLGIIAPERTFIGFDPSSRRASTQRIRIEPCYFDRGTARRANGAIAAVVSRHVIEHLPSPVDFLMTIRATLPDLWPGHVFTETPTVEWILDNRATYDFFYEHCNYFTKQTLEFALSLAGLACSSVDLVFGDQYLWAESSVGSNPAPMRARPLSAKPRLRPASSPAWKRSSVS